MNESERQELLKSIALEGAASEENKVNHIVLGSRNNLNHIAGKSSGRMKIYPSIVKKFELILQQPKLLAPLSPFEIRCVLCKKVIRYPAWYYFADQYVVNKFHYFVCFDPASPMSVNERCYRPDSL